MLGNKHLGDGIKILKLAKGKRDEERKKIYQVSLPPSGEEKFLRRVERDTGHVCWEARGR